MKASIELLKFLGQPEVPNMDSYERAHTHLEFAEVMLRSEFRPKVRRELEGARDVWAAYLESLCRGK